MRIGICCTINQVFIIVLEPSIMNIFGKTIKMKTIYFLLFSLSLSFFSNSQTAFRKKYYFPDYVILKSKKDGSLRKTKFSNDSKDSSSGQKIELSYSDSSKPNVAIVQALNKEYPAYKKKNYPKRLKANVKFEGDKLFVNPWYMYDSVVRGRDYYFKLDNRQQIKLHYQQLTFTALTIPLKVQFGRNNTVNYQTGISIGSLFGYSWGSTRFTYRSKLDNFERSQEFTIGGLVNVSSAKFKDSYEREINSASIGLGIGFLYTYESISVGFTYGFEWALGESSQDWNYNDRPWLGLALGYSLFDK